MSLNLALCLHITLDSFAWDLTSRALLRGCLAAFHAWHLYVFIMLFMLFTSYLVCTEVSIMDYALWYVTGLLTLILIIYFIQERNNGYVAGSIACEIQ